MPEAQKLAREYELVYILRPTVGPSEARKVSDRINGIVEKHDAKLTRVDNWGKRKLAYPIRKHTRGVFVLVKFVGFGGIVAELERHMRILDDVMRWQTIRMDTLHDLASVDVDPEEVQFRDIEPDEADEEEPTFEERLGMKSREREREKADKEKADKEKAENAEQAADEKAGEEKAESGAGETSEAGGESGESSDEGSSEASSSDETEKKSEED